MMKYISYVLIALLLVTAGYAMTEHTKAVGETARADGLDTALKQQIASMDLLRDSVDSSNRITVGMNQRLDKIAATGNVVTERVITLEKTDALIHDFLALKLPSNGCLLDNSCSYPGSLHPTISGTDAALPGPAPGEVRGSP